MNDFPAHLARTNDQTACERFTRSPSCGGVGGRGCFDMSTNEDHESELLARIAALESELRRLLDLVGVEDRESIERVLDEKEEE